jgi:Protein of unknown function (DUF3352)
VRALAAGAVAAVALAGAGCGGGGGGGSLPDGASIAPASAIGFVSINTDFSSAQWKQVTKLAADFPGTPQLIAKFTKATGLKFGPDVKPALGPEVDIVWLDARNNGDDVVALTKPESIEKAKAVVHKLDQTSPPPSVTGVVEGWFVVTGKKAVLAQFKKAAAGPKLSGDNEFKAAFGKLGSDSSVRAWVKGGFVQSEMDRGLASSGAPPGLTHDVGDLKAIVGSGKAESDGASIELDGVIDPAPDPATFSPSLPSDVPSGALLYVGATHLDAPLRTILRLVGKSQPNFDTQLSQAESVLGLSLDKDVYPLLKGESALAVYRATGRIPRVLFVQKVDDTAKAKSLLKRFSAIAQLGGSIRVESIQLAGESVDKLTLPGATIYDGAANGKLFVTNAQNLAEQTIRGPSDSLGNDPLFKSSRAAAKMPGQVAAFAYGDLKNGLPVVLSLAQQSGSQVPPAAFANVKPLQGAVAYLVKDGDALRISGFQTIK